MSVNTMFGSVRNLMPRPRRPRLARRTGHSGWSMRPAALGLELRGTSLFVACLWPGVNRRWLSVTGVIEDIPGLTSEQLREKLRELIAPAGVEDPTVVLGLPRRDVIVRHITLPIAAERSLANALNLQLGLYKPSDDEDFCWDAAVVRSSEQLGVSLALVPRMRVEELASKLHDAGFPVSHLTTAQFSTIEWVLRAVEDRENARIVLAQSRGAEAELALIEKRKCVASRSFLRNSSHDSAVSDEIRKMLAAHRVPASDPLTVVYSGADAAEWRGSLAQLGEAKELPQFCDAWALTETTGTPPDEFWGAIALALDGLNWTGDYHLNLMPKELRAARRRWHNAPTYALLVANVILLTALAARGPIQREITLRQYNREIAKVERNASLVEKKINKQEKIEAHIAALESFQERGRRPIDALSSVAQKLPPDAWLNVYTCREQKVDLSGTAKSASAVLPALKTIAQFDEVQFAGGLTRDAEGTERFHIQLKLKDMQ